MKSLPENIKLQIIANLKSGKKLESLVLLKSIGNTLGESDIILKKIESELNETIIAKDEFLAIKEVFSKFFEENIEFLIPGEINKNSWQNGAVLFTTNEKVKGEIIFKFDKVHFKLKHKIWAPYTLGAVRYYNSSDWFNKPLEEIKNGEFRFPVEINGRMLFEKIPILSENIRVSIENSKLEKAREIREQQEILENEMLEKERKIREQQEILENERIKNLNASQLEIMSQLDKDGNGQIDLVDCDSYNKLLIKNQKTIIDIDKNYIQKFVKISIYLKTKKNNLQKIFQSIIETKDDNQLSELFNLLRIQVHTYELLLFHSISMVTSIVNSDLITFYEIYERFDELGVFNSSWENEISNQLINIGDGIMDLMYSINQMEHSIVDSIESLTYITQDSFSELKNSIDSELSSIDSSINTTNLLIKLTSWGD